MAKVASGSLFVRSVDGGPPTRITFENVYDGAPAWSHDGTTIAFESTAGDPDGSEGSRILVIDAPRD